MGTRSKKEEEHPTVLETSQNKWIEILALVEAGKLEEFKNKYPAKYLRSRSVFMNIPAQEQVTRMVQE
jgi:hypothetical protein